MHIIRVGLDYKSTPIEYREKFTFARHELPCALHQLRHTKSILECVILSTCNRTEVYALVDQLHTGRHFVKKFLAGWFGIDREELAGYVHIFENDAAIQHIFHVAAGLDSMILGETQILGQMKDAFFVAQEEQATGTIFNTLFKQVITLAKKAHAQTAIGEHAVSISYAAVELSKKICGSLADKSVLLVGAGKMSELTARHLKDHGVKDVYVVNRTHEHALTFAAEFNGKAFKFSDLHDCLQQVDIVISSTGSPGCVLNREEVEAVMENRHNHPLFMIDIAVPRDLDANIHHVDNVFLYDIDDLQHIVDINLEERQKEAHKVNIMIHHEMEAFHQWLATLGVVPLINALRQKALMIQGQTMQSIENKLPDLTERQRKVIKKHTKSIINQMMRDPILGIKELADSSGADASLDLFTQLFSLEEELLQQEKMDQARQLAHRLEKERREALVAIRNTELPLQW